MVGRGRWGGGTYPSVFLWNSFWLLLLTDWCVWTVHPRDCVQSNTHLHVCLCGCILACMRVKKELLSFTRDVCLFIINAHRYLARSDTNPPNRLNTHTHTSMYTHTHTHTHASQGDELSVPVRLGILVSTRFGSPFRGTELRTFSPLSNFQRTTEANTGRKAVNKKERRQTGSESQGQLMILESL